MNLLVVIFFSVQLPVSRLQLQLLIGI